MINSSYTSNNGNSSKSRLQTILETGAFAVTAECGPPQGVNLEVVREKSEFLKGKADAVNVTDNQTSIIRMSSIAVALYLLQMGIEPVMQIVCRDRNRIAIQSDLLGAAGWGLKNVLCLSGDHQQFGKNAMAKNVYDMDSLQLLQVVKAMRDERKLSCGTEIEGQPGFFIGAAANPFADPFLFRVLRLEKKFTAGANFIQTQCIFNVEKFQRFMTEVRNLGLHEKIFILAGVTPLKSLGMAKYMKTKVPGMDVPDELIDRMQKAPKEAKAEEGIKICVETIQRLREIPGVAGIHLMAIEWEQKVPEILERAGLLPRPQVG